MEPFFSILCFLSLHQLRFACIFALRFLIRYLFLCLRSLFFLLCTTFLNWYFIGLVFAIVNLHCFQTCSCFRQQKARLADVLRLALVGHLRSHTEMQKSAVTWDGKTSKKAFQNLIIAQCDWGLGCTRLYSIALHHAVLFILVRKLKQKCLSSTVKCEPTGSCSNSVFVLLQPSILLGWLCKKNAGMLLTFSSLEKYFPRKQCVFSN